MRRLGVMILSMAMMGPFAAAASAADDYGSYYPPVK
jgi:hypothetical protein